MKNLITTTLLLSVPLWISAQFHDFNWITSYPFIDGEHHHANHINFSGNNISSTHFLTDLNIYLTNSTFSDSFGDIQFYSNGIQVYNSLNQLMENGDTILPGEQALEWIDKGYWLQDGMMCVPWPDSNHLVFCSQLYTEFTDSFFLNFQRPHVFYSVIDMSKNAGLGKVVSKHNMLFSAIDLDPPQMVRHANGLDWWIISPDRHNTKIYYALLTPNGIAETGFQELNYYKPPPNEINDRTGQNMFSPDGKFFVDNTGCNGARVFSFDRCSGTFEFLETLPIYGIEWWPDSTSHGCEALGASISPDSKNLYLQKPREIIQFNLLADNIWLTADTVAVLDSFINPIANSLMYFWFMELMPDGKIYCIDDASKHIHVIEYPDRLGENCLVKQHYVELPNHYAGSIANFPNYRLGPIDGSPCDTLGINNVPLARFRYNRDSINNPYLVEFIDLSDYEPTDWSWDFDDNSMSSDTSPVHLFSGQGIYEVCQTVSNQYGSDTFCQALDLGTVSSSIADQEYYLRIFPNPADEVINVQCQLSSGSKIPLIQLYNSIGRLVYSAAGNHISIPCKHFSDGVYILSVAGSEYKKKVVIQH